MARQEATTVVGVRLEAVEDRLGDVEEWPRFLLGLHQVHRRGSGRWTFLVHDGARPRELDVTIDVDLDNHRIVWRAMSGPRFEGVWTLVPDGNGTRIELTLDADPMGLVAGLAELLGRSDDTASLDLRRLEEHLAA